MTLNSMLKKYLSIQELTKRTFDIFLMSETKTDVHFQMRNLNAI